MGTQNGLNYLPSDQDKLLHFNHSKNGIPHNKVTALLMDHNKQLWVGTKNGVAVLQEDSAQFQAPIKNTLFFTYDNF